MSRRDLAHTALLEALRFRRQNGLAIDEAFDIFDLTASIGIEVRFVDVPSLEAIYINSDPPRILVSSHRPMARQVFNCAHEVGHHVFGHSSRVEEYIDPSVGQQPFQPDEYQADRFASFLLMPKTHVNRAFMDRGIAPSESTPLQVYAIAGWLGVGYSTLVHQMSLSLGLMTAQKAKEVLRVPPKRVRKDLFPHQSPGSALVIDSNWRDRSIDVQAGDCLMLPGGVEFDGRCLTCISVEPERSAFQATRPGIGRLADSGTGWSAFVRVSKHGFVGRSIFRHLEDPEHE